MLTTPDPGNLILRTPIPGNLLLATPTSGIPMLTNSTPGTDLMLAIPTPGKLTSTTRGNLMLTPTPGKLMLTSPTQGRESDIEDAQSQKSRNFPINSVQPGELC